ncbi:glycoside hydrolase superfamily, partial [Microdochium trichocladiopsis]
MWHADDVAVASINERPFPDMLQAVRHLKEYLGAEAPSCHEKILFIYLRGTLVGLFSGSRVDHHETSASILDQFSDQLQQNQDALLSSTSGRMATLDLCNKQSSTGDIFGVVAHINADFAAVQQVMRGWHDAKCATDQSTPSGWYTKSLNETLIWAYPTAVVHGTPLNDTRSLRGSTSSLIRRADCRSITVEAGDDCPKLAKRCGLAAFAFESFNKATKDLCSTLKKGQPVCCSSGSLPDIKPKPGADGVCAYYDVESGFGCYEIAAKHGITVDDLSLFNKKTWGWAGCNAIQNSQRVCVSKGNPPMPHQDPNAVCGPTVKGSKPPSGDEELADLNPCPLSVCCNVWGNCGTDKDFCVVNRASTGNPGTSKPGANSCVANCGMDIINNSTAPAQYRKIGYFEGWNQERKCLHMHVNDIDSSYTHVHFAFAEISPSLQVSIPANTKTQWDAFINQETGSNGYKKILAFGGWAFSNDPATSHMFRLAFSPSNRETFATNVVNFLVSAGIDGLDFDWEYPGADDIEGSQPGEKDDGDNYYEFLKLVRGKLPKGKSLSIATASSYWYLRGFPIKKMATVLDYIVYMTYDLHGQWDAGNKWGSSGCPGGNCLRSHINATETHSSLVMITKAGVPSHKVVVGITSYGRSFKMASAGCRGPDCTFLGDNGNSLAKKGRCTDTAGYISDFEIGEIVDKGGLIKTWYDDKTDSDYLVYEATEWVAYMGNATKQRRMAQYKRMNFGGTSDWAIDLQ